MRKNHPFPTQVKRLQDLNAALSMQVKEADLSPRLQKVRGENQKLNSYVKELASALEESTQQRDALEANLEHQRTVEVREALKVVEQVKAAAASDREEIKRLESEKDDAVAAAETTESAPQTALLW